MKFSNSQIDEIRNKLNLEEVISEYTEGLKPQSGNMVCPCLFHQETQPSMHIYPDGHFYCFGCQENGDVFSFIQKIEGIGFPQAVEMLAKKAGVKLHPDQEGKRSSKKKSSVSKEVFYETLRKSADLFIKNLHASHGSHAYKYLKERGLSDEIIASFELGFAQESWSSLKKHLTASVGVPAGIESRVLSVKQERVFDTFRNRLMFPIKDVAGRTVAFGGRALEDEEPKYLNSSESPFFKKSKLLYGMDQARKAIALENEAIVSEGYVDVLSLHQFGFSNSVGVLGTAFTKEQAQILSNLCDSLLFIFDGDAAGRRAAFKATSLALQAGSNCRVVLLPEGEDADSSLQKYGAQFMYRARGSAPDGLSFCLEMLKRGAPKRVIEWLKQFMANLRDYRLRAFYLPQIVNELNLSEEEFRRWEEYGISSTEAERIAFPAPSGDVCASPPEEPAPAPLDISDQDLEILWGFAVQPTYCAHIPKDFSFPFSSQAGEIIFNKLKDGATFTAQEEGLLERCRTLYRGPKSLHDWFSGLRATFGDFSSNHM